MTGTYVAYRNYPCKWYRSLIPSTSILPPNTLRVLCFENKGNCAFLWCMSETDWIGFFSTSFFPFWNTAAVLKNSAPHWCCTLSFSARKQSKASARKAKPSKSKRINQSTAKHSKAQQSKAQQSKASKFEQIRALSSKFEQN